MGVNVDIDYIFTSKSPGILLHILAITSKPLGYIHGYSKAALSTYRKYHVSPISLRMPYTSYNR